jgi:hypothetical protein
MFPCGGDNAQSCRSQIGAEEAQRPDHVFATISRVLVVIS